MGIICQIALAVLLQAKVRGHAIMYSPTPRSNVFFGPTGITSDGTKIPGFEQAGTHARACGGAENSDPGVEIPQVAYKPGQEVEVEWKLTIPHPEDVLTSGIRIALHFSPTDSFEQNILAGGVVGDPPYTVLAAGPTADIQVDTIPLQKQRVRLPMKTCDYCVLQWVWGAQNDGGVYIGCADVSIKDGGSLPDFSTLKSQEGNELPDGTGVGVAADDSSAGIAIGVILVLLLLAAVGYFYYKKRWPFGHGGPLAARAKAPDDPGGGGHKCGSAASGEAGAPPPPPAAGAPPPPGLPPGWDQFVDPTTSQVYYSNVSTGQTQWTMPLAYQF